MDENSETMSVGPGGQFTDVLNQFLFYCVYQNPSDHSDRFCLRRWVGTTPDEFPMYVGDNLDEIHALIPKHCIFMGPDPIDPVIIEVWM